MAISSNPTFDEIDKHIQAVDLSAYHPGGKHHLAAGTAPAAALPSVCPIYKAILPILVVLSTLPFIPPKWQALIKTFISVMDVLCP